MICPSPLRWLSVFLKTDYYFSFTWIDVESLMTFPLYETVSYHKGGILDALGCYLRNSNSSWLK